ncbi:MAG: phosphatase PAP2 family protein [Ghiorsea sp.]|nr:phosphatase PAP2 family protein [Ghiorsea sp.]
MADFMIGLVSGLADGLVAVVLITMLMLFRFRLGLAALLAFFVSGTVAQVLKRTFDMPRPPTVFNEVHLLGERLSFHSFPSGHSATAGVLAFLALLLWKPYPKLAWSLFVLGALIAYGRIYSGVHFPLDVVVGFAIGIVSMWWCNNISQTWDTKKWQQSEWSWKLPGLLLMIAAVILGTGYHIQPITAQPLTLIVPIIALFTLMHAWKKKLYHG